MRPRERWNNVGLRRGHKGDKSGLNEPSFAPLPHNQLRRFPARQTSAVGSARTSLIFRSRIICFLSFIDPRLFPEDPFFVPNVPTFVCLAACGCSLSGAALAKWVGSCHLSTMQLLSPGGHFDSTPGDSVGVVVMFSACCWVTTGRAFQ